MSQAPLIKVSNLKTFLDTSNGVLRAVDGVSFEIRKGETFALLGESGCGKSMTALSMIGLVPDPVGKIVDGHIELEGEDLTTYSEVDMRSVRGNRIAMIFQEPMTSLNPVLTIGEQIRETLKQHKSIKGAAANARVVELLTAVGIPDAGRRLDEYPHQLSGGMKQRVMIAIALAAEPDLLIADEPTTALDVTIQAQVLDLLTDLQKKTGMAIMLITHDLGVVHDLADTIAVMYAGEIVEHADRDSFFNDPKHPYSQRLFKSLPSMEKRDQALAIIPGTVPSLTQTFEGCRFEQRCGFAWEYCRTHIPATTGLNETHDVMCHLYTDQAGDAPKVTAEPDTIPGSNARAARIDANELLDVTDLKVHFPITRGLFKRVAGYVYAVDGVEVNIKPGRTLALVGESGCGKTTVGKGILQLLPDYTQGIVNFEKTDLMTLKGEDLRQRRSEFQIIFQDPYSSMNPRMMVGDIIEEGMNALGLQPDPVKRLARIEELLSMVGLEPAMRTRYPHEFSGGQRQRICIARALAVNPKLIVCDEPTSALDVSVQAQILNLLKDLQDKLDLAYLFITHDISVVAYLADEVAVMYLGRIVEQGPVEEILENPKHPYTRALLSAVPEIDERKQKQKILLKGDLPSPSNPPKGCHFHPRCPDVLDKCRVAYPDTSVEEGHKTRCHLFA